MLSLDELTTLRMETFHQAVPILGSQLATQCRGTDDIAKNHGHLPPLGARQRARPLLIECRVEPGSAAAAKAGQRRIPRAALGTNQRDNGVATLALRDTDGDSKVTVGAPGHGFAPYQHAG